MTFSLELKQKIIDLILTECGHTSTAETRDYLFQDPSFSEQVERLIENMDSLLSRSPTSVKEQAPLSHNTDTSVDDNEKHDLADATVVEHADNDSAERHSGEAPHSELWKLMPFYSFDKSDRHDASVLSYQALKPGQIPTEQQRAQNLVKPTLLPLGRISLPNARAGEHFTSVVAILLDDGQQADIIDVIFPHDIGLAFVKEQQILSGIPTESGDFDITIRWSCASHDKGETKILFVVNPDPRSLWKVIEPPLDAPYRKAHLASNGLVSEEIRIVAASRRGRSHEHAGSFRDDDFYINHSAETGWSIMLAADGAGSAINSRQGSLIAAQTAGDYLYSQLNGKKGITLKEYIIAWGAEEQQATISAMLHHFKQAATLAVNSIQNEAICAEQPVKSYSTTLLATVSLRLGDELFAAAFWLGDGAIAAYSPSGNVRILGNPDSGEYAGQTRFLDQSIITDTAFTGRISIGKWNDVSHLILMTDGVSDPWFETDNGLRNNEKWTRLVNELSPVLEDAERAPAGLVEWLNFFSPGNHDDRTIVLSW